MVTTRDVTKAKVAILAVSRAMNRAFDCGKFDRGDKLADARRRLQRVEERPAR